MSNPLETLWSWASRMPSPVVVALLVILSGWVYALENRVAEQDQSLARIEATLVQVDTNVQTLLQAMLWQNKTAETPRKENR
jgi:ATP/maltotriose-dependent transcriptional regulator MalT